MAFLLLVHFFATRLLFSDWEPEIGKLTGRQIVTKKMPGKCPGLIGLFEIWLSHYPVNVFEKAQQLKAHHPFVTLNKTHPCAHLCNTSEARGIMGHGKAKKSQDYKRLKYIILIKKSSDLYRKRSYILHSNATSINYYKVERNLKCQKFDKISATLVWPSLLRSRFKVVTGRSFALQA